MSNKRRPSRLDQYAAPLADMEVAGKTLAEMQAWLKDEGCAITLSALSSWLSRERDRRQQARLLDQIASGAQQVREVEKQFSKNPAPELDTLIKLQRVILLSLSTQAGTDPSTLELIGNSFRAVMDSEKLKLKRQELELNKEKFDHLKQMADKGERTDKVLSDAELTPEQRVQRIKEIYGRA
jgi:DNA-binding phage protein